MRVYVNDNATPPILFIIPTNQDEHDKFVDFCRLNEPLVVVMRKDRGYQFQHIEIRKERN